MTDRNRTDDNALMETLTSGFASARRTGLIIAFLVFGVFGIWATTAPIDGAAHAPGTVTARSNNKVVQHLEGGIISEILTENGDRVEAGDPLVHLDATQSRAELAMANVQLAAGEAREARLLAERDGLEQVEFETDISAASPVEVAEMLSQRAVFQARREARLGQIDMLEQRVRQLRSQLEGLHSQRESKQSLVTSYADELEEVRGLLADGFSDTNRLRSVERNHSTLRGEIAELDSNIATTEMRITETQTEIKQVEREFFAEVVTELGETRSQLEDLRERRTALQDVVDRKIVRAPDAGIVNGMDIHTVGAVIAPGDPIAEIVPEGDELIIEARVSPMDIDRVAVGQDASVRFSSLNAQTTPRLTGTVINLSADAFVEEQSGNSYYQARISVEPSELESLGGSAIVLVPGMPAEVFINSGERTLMQYLLKPLTNAMARSFIED
ncbi:MAG: HlyD family type I secretion periplasmic adaptor subunit [Pseudohongiellaceae bacterium]